LDTPTCDFANSFNLLQVHFTQQVCVHQTCNVSIKKLVCDLHRKIGFVDIFNGGTLTLTNSTVSGNTGGNGGGINNQSGSAVNARNTIIAGNTASNGPDVFGSFTSPGHNLIGKSDGSSGFGGNGDQVGTIASPRNPMLDPLANNGGPTQTHALLPVSPAIDAGDDCVAEATHCGDSNIPQLTTDQRGAGFPRKIDSNGDSTATVDIGAFEAPTVVTHTLTASAGSNGSISPSGTVIVVDGADQAFTLDNTTLSSFALLTAGNSGFSLG